MTQEERRALVGQDNIMEQDGQLFYIATPTGNDEAHIKECDELWVCRTEWLGLEVIAKAVQIAQRHNVPAYFVQIADEEKRKISRREIVATMIRLPREQ